MNDLVLTLLATLVTGSGAGGLVGWVMSRNKIGAETNQLEAQAAEIIERTAGASVERLSRELDHVRSELQVVRSELQDERRARERIERRELAARDLLMVHGGWDHRVQEELEKRLSADEIEALGLYPAPPLYPRMGDER